MHENPYCCISTLLLLASYSQHVLSHFEIPEQAQVGYEYLINDKNDNLYIGFRVATWLPAVLGDTSLYGHRYDTAAGLGLSDLHLVKYDTDYDLKASFVIDNAEWIRDFYATEGNAFVSLSSIIQFAKAKRLTRSSTYSPFKVSYFLPHGEKYFSLSRSQGVQKKQY